MDIYKALNSSKKAEELVYDLEQTWNINMQMLEIILDTSPEILIDTEKNTKNNYENNILHVIDEKKEIKEINKLKRNLPNIPKSQASQNNHTGNTKSTNSTITKEDMKDKVSHKENINAFFLL